LPSGASNPLFLYLTVRSSPECRRDRLPEAAPLHALTLPHPYGEHLHEVTAVLLLLVDPLHQDRYLREMDAMAMLEGEVAVAAHREAEAQVAVTGGHIEIAATRAA